MLTLAFDTEHKSASGLREALNISNRHRQARLLLPNCRLETSTQREPLQNPPSWRQIGIGSKGVIYTPATTSAQVFKPAIIDHNVLWIDHHKY